MNEYYPNFIDKNKLRIFNIDPHKLRGKKFFEEIFNYRKKIYKAQKIRIKKKKSFKCNLCGSKKGKTFLTWKQKYELISCTKCNSVSPNINFKNESKFIESVYNDKIYTKKAFEAIFKNYQYRKKKFGKERYDYCIKRLGLNTKDKILDLGCGFGYFINYLKSKKIYAKGIEPSKNITEYCKSKLKLNVTSDKLENEKNNYYNLITLFDVLEHLKDPCTYFKTINKKLKKNGFCVAYTPNIHSFSYALMGSNQNTMLPFEHLCFFNEKSLKYLAQKSGFKITKIETYGFDVMDYMLLKEFQDKFEYTKKFKEFINLIQPILDKFNLSNHFRITFKKIK